MNDADFDPLVLKSEFDRLCAERSALLTAAMRQQDEILELRKMLVEVRALLMRYQRGDSTHPIRCRWWVNAAGRTLERVRALLDKGTMGDERQRKV